MKCPYKENSEYYKKAGKYLLAGFLAVLGIAVSLKIITTILLIFPGEIKDNTWLVVVATVIVVLASCKYCKKSKCCENKESTSDK